MSSSGTPHLSRGRKALNGYFLPCLLILAFVATEARSEDSALVIRGEVQTELSLSLVDIKAMLPFLIRDVPVIPEWVRDRKDEELVTLTTFRSVRLLASALF